MLYSADGLSSASSDTIRTDMMKVDSHSLSVSLSLCHYLFPYKLLNTF